MLPVTGYGLFMALAFLAGSFVVWRRAKEEAFDSEKIFDGIIWTVLFALLGARLHFIFLNFKHFGFNLLQWFWLTRYAGLCFHGGVLGGIFGLFLFTKREKWDFWQTADIAVFGLALGQAIAKIGSQIDETLLALFVFYFLLKMERRYRMFSWYKSKAPGFLFLSYLLFYHSGRFFLENLRGDSIYLSGLIVLASLVGLYLRSGREWQEDKALISENLKAKIMVLRMRRKKGKKIKRGIKVGRDIK